MCGMNCKKTGFVFPLLFFCMIEIVFSQGQQALGYNSYYPKFTKVGFSRNLNVFEWNYRLNYQKQIDKKIRFQIREEFRSTLQRVFSGDNWKDDQNFDVGLHFPITQKIQVSTSFNSKILIDPLDNTTNPATATRVYRRTGLPLIPHEIRYRDPNDQAGVSERFDNDFTSTSSKVEAKYKPLSKLTISPSTTLKWQTQLEQKDQGYGFGLDVDIDKFYLDKSQNDFSLSGQFVSFPQRKNHDLHIKYRIERQFYESTADTLNIVVDRLRRDSFGLEGNQLFVRNLTQTNRGFENRLSYRIAKDATVFLNNALYSTSTRINNLKSDEKKLKKDDTGFESNNSFRFSYAKPTWFTNVGWESSIKSREDNREDKTPDPFGHNPTIGFNTETALVKLSGIVGVRISEKDSIGATASVSKFQYETTNETNPNDHDQQKWQFTLAYSHQFSEDLKLVWQASAFLNHFVFISGNFSSGNNWERNFQLSPQIIYEPNSKFYFKQRFTVRSKYQTYDFDQQEISNRNSVNRQFLIKNNSAYRLSHHNRIEFAFNYEFAEQGKFFFDLWRQTLALSWQGIKTQLLYKHRFNNGLNFSTGANIFHQTRWQHKQKTSGETEKSIQSEHTNYGPKFEISYKPDNKMEVALSGNVQISKPHQRESEYIQNYDINLNWFF